MTFEALVTSRSEDGTVSSAVETLDTSRLPGPDLAATK